MQHFITRNWLILSIASILVALYVWIFDGFIQGKAYVFVLLAAVFLGIYLRKQKK